MRWRWQWQERGKDNFKKGMELENRKRTQMQICGQITAEKGREINRRIRVKYSGKMLRMNAKS